MAAKKNTGRRRGNGGRQAPTGGSETYEIEFFEDDDGKKPVLDWIKDDLSSTKRRVLGYAMREILQSHGVGVCQSSWGKQLGGGIFEFRVRMDGSQAIDDDAETKAGAAERILLRVFCHAYGNKVVLLLAGYDKGEDPSKRRQQKELGLAKTRLNLHKKRLGDAKKQQKRDRG